MLTKYLNLAGLLRLFSLYKIRYTSNIVSALRIFISWDISRFFGYVYGESADYLNGSKNIEFEHSSLFMVNSKLELYLRLIAKLILFNFIYKLYKTRKNELQETMKQDLENNEERKDTGSKSENLNSLKNEERLSMQSISMSSTRNLVKTNQILPVKSVWDLNPTGKSGSIIQELSNSEEEKSVDSENDCNNND